MVLKEINLIIDIEDGVIRDYNVIPADSIRMKDPEVQRICSDTKFFSCPHCLNHLEIVLHLASSSGTVEYLDDINDATGLNENDVTNSEMQMITDDMEHITQQMESEWEGEYVRIIENTDKKDARQRKEKQALMNRAFCCGSCDKCFRNKAALIAHQRTCKSGPVLYDHKYKSVEQKLSREQKYLNALQRRDHYCKLCHKLFKNSAALIAHKKTCTGDDIRCDLCAEQFESRKKLSKHISVAHNKMNHICFICGSAFKAKWLLEEHFARHSDPKPFKCDICERGFSSKETLKIHMKANHLPSFIGHKCTLCEKSYTTNSKLSRHMKTRHHSLGSFICGSCSVKFGTEKALKQHIFNIHTPSEQKKLYKCTLCDHKATTQSRIEKHQLIHLDPKEWPFSCDTCGKRFVQKHSLERHLTIHTGVKPFYCDICGQAFRLAYQVKSHMLIHQPNLKPFQCSYCEKAYRDRASFNNHVRSHDSIDEVPNNLVVFESHYEEIENI